MSGRPGQAGQAPPGDVHDTWATGAQPASQQLAGHPAPNSKALACSQQGSRRAPDRSLPLLAGCRPILLQRRSREGGRPASKGDEGIWRMVNEAHTPRCRQGRCSREVGVLVGDESH